MAKQLRLATRQGALSGLAAVVDGEDDRPLVIALHGGSYDARYFHETASPGHSLLETMALLGFDAMAVDRPGYGASRAWCPDGLDFAGQLEVLEGVVTGLAKQRSGPVFLVGHSIGGMLAVGLAASPRLARLVAGVALSGAGSVYHSRTLAAFRSVAVVDGRIVRDTSARPRVMFGADWTVDPRVVASDAALGPTGPASPIVEFENAQLWPELIETWGPRVEAPVHYVLAEFDAIWHSRAEDVERARVCFRNARHLHAFVQPGAGHSLDQHLVASSYHARVAAFFLESMVLQHARGEAGSEHSPS